MLTPERKSAAATRAPGVGAALVAVGCCAGLPAIGALLGGLTLGTVLGFGLGAVILGAIVWTAVALITRRHHRPRQPTRSVRR